MFKTQNKTWLLTAAILISFALPGLAHAQYSPRTVRKALATELAPGTALDGVTAAAEALIPFTGEGSQTIPTSRINRQGARIPFKFSWITTSDDDNVETLRTRIRLGGLTGQTLADTGALVIGAASHTAIVWTIEGEIVCKTTGATGTGYATGTVNYSLGAGAVVETKFYTPFTAFDFTTAPALVGTAIFGATPDAGDTIQQVQCSIDSINYD